MSCQRWYEEKVGSVEKGEDDRRGGGEAMSERDKKLRGISPFPLASSSLR